MEPRGRGLFICIPLYHSSSFPSGRARFSSSVSARSSPALRRRRRRTVAAAWGPGAQAGAGRFQLSEAPPWHSLEERHEGCSDCCLPTRTHRWLCCLLTPGWLQSGARDMGTCWPLQGDGDGLGTGEMLSANLPAAPEFLLLLYLSGGVRLWKVVVLQTRSSPGQEHRAAPVRWLTPQRPS